MSKAKPRFTRNNPSLPPAVPNLFELLVFGTCEGANTVNTFYYADGGAALVPTSEHDLAAAWVLAMQPVYCAACSSDWDMTAVKVQCLTTPSRAPFINAVAFPGTGPGGHEPMTTGVTIQRVTGVKGQSGRGRVTIPAVPTAWVTGSVLTTPGAHQTLATDIGTGFIGAGITYVPQLASRGNRKGPALGASPILHTHTDLVLGSARRRKINR
jgi:hypothetical protein